MRRIISAETGGDYPRLKQGRLTEHEQRVAQELVQAPLLIDDGSELTAEAMPNLRTMTDLTEYWIEVNRLENQADQIHRKLLAHLFGGSYEAIEVLKLKQIVDVLEEAADGRVAFEADGDFVRVAGFAVRACLGQQLRACGPIGLVFGEPRIGGHVLHGVESGARAVQLRDREGAVDGDHR